MSYLNIIPYPSKCTCLKTDTAPSGKEFSTALVSVELLNSSFSASGAVSFSFIVSVLFLCDYYPQIILADLHFSFFRPVVYFSVLFRWSFPGFLRCIEFSVYFSWVFFFLFSPRVRLVLRSFQLAFSLCFKSALKSLVTYAGTV